MLRKQLYLTPEIAHGLALAASRERRTVAEVVREILAKGLKIKKPSGNGGEALLRMAKEAGRGPRDLSKNFADYLYGRRSPNYGKSGKTSR